MALVHELAGGGLVPGRPLAAISLADVRRAISGRAPEPVGGPCEALVSGILASADGMAAQALAAHSCGELCARVRQNALCPRGASQASAVES
jgi:hypothetical protein